MIAFIKHLVAGREIAALERYRDATHAAWRHLTTVQNASAVAEWIAGHGEGQHDTPIADLRNDLVELQTDRDLQVQMRAPGYTPKRDSQHVLKAEASGPDATDRENPAQPESPGRRTYGRTGQPAAAGPAGERSHQS